MALKSKIDSSSKAKDKTIDDYKSDYNDAKGRGDATGMEKANEGANSIREKNGQDKEYATGDIDSVKASHDGSWIGGSSSSTGISTTKSSSGGGGGGSSPSYTPSKTTRPPIDVSGLYDAIEKARLEAFERAKKENLRKLEEQLSQIDAGYEDSVRSTQIASRISALGNEEKLAALGLNMGSAYSAPTSGYAETSRIAQDNNLRTNLNQLANAREQSKNMARSAVSSANAALDGDASELSAKIKLQAIQDMINQYNADRDYDYKEQQLQIDRLKTEMEQKLAQEKLAYQQNQDALKQGQTEAERQAQLEKEKAKQELERETANQKLMQQQAQTAYENALERWKLYGSVLPADASILGVPAGTKTSAQAYQDAKYKLEQMKTLHQISK